MSFLSTAMQAGSSLLPSPIGAGLNVLSGIFGAASASNEQAELERKRQQEELRMRQMMVNQQNAATLQSFPTKGINNPQIYAEGGQLNMSDDEVGLSNKDYFEQRVKEVGLEEATQEYNQVFGNSPEWLQNETLPQTPKKRRFTIKG